MAEVARLSSQKLERLDGKLSRVVLRGEGCGDVSPPTRRDLGGDAEVTGSRSTGMLGVMTDVSLRKPDCRLLGCYGRLGTTSSC